MLLKGVGGDVLSHDKSSCCSNCCGGVVPYPELDILQTGRATRTKRNVRLREVPEEMVVSVQQQLMKARSSFISSSPGLKMLRPDYVCPDDVISSISSSLDYIQSPSDLGNFFLSSRLREMFFSIVIDTVKEAPPPKRHKKNK